VGFVGCVESGSQLDFVNVFGKLLIFGGFVEVGVSAFEVRRSIQLSYGRVQRLLIKVTGLRAVRNGEK